MKGSNKGINTELALLFNRTNHLLQKARQKELDKYGISLQTSGILNIIVRSDKKATPGSIARELFIERHSVSEMLARMEMEGLVKRIKDLERKNLIRLELTDKGYDAYLKSNVREVLDDILSALTESEKLELWPLLSKIRTRAMKHMKIKEIDIYPPSNLVKL